MTAVSKTAVATNAQTSKLTPVNSSTSTEAISQTKEMQPGTQEITPPITPVFTPPITQQITIHDVMKMLDLGNQKRELHEEFSKKLLNVESFKQRHEGGSLRMIIVSSEDTDDEITVSNHEIIIEALEKTVTKGRDYLKKIEMELLSIF